MNPWLLPIITAALSGPLAGAAVAYLMARYRASGKITTTEAATLWDAQEQFRRDQAEEIARLRTEGAEKDAAYKADLADLRAKLETCEAKHVIKDGEIADLHSELDKVKAALRVAGKE